jgi:hypothetical protein
MKKNELTENQKTIISDITNEFVKINESKSKIKEEGFINFSSIYSERNKDMETRREIELYNKSVLQSNRDFVYTIMDTLNLELNEHGLNCFFREDKEYNIHHFLTINDIHNQLGQQSFSISFDRKHSTEYFESGIDQISKYKPITLFYLNSTCSRKFENLEDMCSSEEFIKSLKKLMLSIKY